MKNYKITEDQIKQLAKGNKKVEKMFPEVFETEIELNKWYKREDCPGSIIFINKKLRQIIFHKRSKKGKHKYILLKKY